MTLDGASSTVASLVGLPTTSDFTYNTTLYNVQSLSATAHTLQVALVDYVYGNGTTMGSLIRFDYAAVNDTAPSVVAPSASGAGGPTTTTATTPSAVPSPSGSGSGSAVSSRSALGPIVGGTVGGIVVIAAMILALIFCRRKRKQGPLQPMYFESRPSHAPTAAALYTSHFPSSPQMVEPFPYAPSSGSSALLSPPSSAFVVSSASTEALSEDASQRYAAPARPSKRTQSAGTSSPAPRVLPTSPPPPPPPPPPALDGLTEEQAIFINNLRSANVPAAEIGGLMEIMRRERAGSLGEAGGGAQAAVDAPPRYDFKSPA